MPGNSSLDFLAASWDGIFKPYFYHLMSIFADRIFHLKVIKNLQN
jgi:hypothetical protein